MKDRLPGEAELLQYIQEYWYYGAMLEQLDGLFSYQRKSQHQEPVSVPQLLEVLVAYGDVRFDGKLYYPTQRAVKAQPEEEITRVSQLTYVCGGGHEFIVSIRGYLDAAKVIQCVVDECPFDAER